MSLLKNEEIRLILQNWSRILSLFSIVPTELLNLMFEYSKSICEWDPSFQSQNLSFSNNFSTVELHKQDSSAIGNYIFDINPSSKNKIIIDFEIDSLNSAYNAAYLGLIDMKQPIPKQHKCNKIGRFYEHFPAANITGPVFCWHSRQGSSWRTSPWKMFFREFKSGKKVKQKVVTQYIVCAKDIVRFEVNQIDKSCKLYKCHQNKEFELLHEYNENVVPNTFTVATSIFQAKGHKVTIL